MKRIYSYLCINGCRNAYKSQHKVAYAESVAFSLRAYAFT